uniref:lipid droplet assembly factor 1-like n=1 Tax=Gasterosteus aculeatus aculeatus TaxID=481459 RepID=UPI001A984477|nr:lipid droplet assembly factor 1-like [Gasterosteus aculeatus aculeatus]
MQQVSQKSGPDFQRLWGRWAGLFKPIYGDSRVEQLMDTRAGQYLSSHPFLALNVLLFGAAAALPVGLFLSFALVTLVMSAVGFLCFEVFLLFAGGLTLLSVLPGIALFSVSASVIFNALYVTTYNIFSRYFPHLTKQGDVLDDLDESKESEFDN